jgi:hypothetical protein
MLHVDPLIKKCQMCGIPLMVRNKKSKFCPVPAYCRYDNQQRKRNPKIVNLMQNRDSNFYYLLGLIASDGHLHSNSYGVEITINTKDINVLFEIQNLYGGAITNKKDHTSIWRVSYKPFYEYLLSIGITTLKSLTLNIEKFFNSLSSDNKIHFIRGIVDGDGGVRVYEYFNKRRNQLTCYLHFDICSGSENLLKTIANFINNQFKQSLVNVKYESKAKAFYIKKVGAILPINLLEFLYSNFSKNCIGINRKYYTFISYKQFYNNTKNKTKKVEPSLKARGRLFEFESDSYIPNELKRVQSLGVTTNELRFSKINK